MYQLAATAGRNTSILALEGSQKPTTSLISKFDIGSDSLSLAYDQTLVICSQNTLHLPAQDQEINLPHAYSTANCVLFGTKSNRFMYIASNHAILIFDRKENKYLQPIKTPDTVTCLSLTSDDSKIAAGLASGNVLVHSLKHNTTSVLGSPFEGSVNAISFYPFKKSILVAGGQDGTLAVWDVNLKSDPILVKSRIHSAPISGLAFAPCNKHFYCSIGLDKMLCFHDIASTNTKGLLQSFKAEHPLKSIAINDDHLVAVGDQSGCIFFYDVRTKSVLNTVAFSDDPVTCLVFQPPKWAVTAALKDPQNQMPMGMNQIANNKSQTLNGIKSQHILENGKLPETKKTIEPTSSLAQTIHGDQAKESMATIHQGLKNLKSQQSKQYLDMFSPIAKGTVKSSSAPDLRKSSSLKNMKDSLKTDSGPAKSIISRKPLTNRSKSYEGLSDVKSHWSARSKQDITDVIVEEVVDRFGGLVGGNNRDDAQTGESIVRPPSVSTLRPQSLSPEAVNSASPQTDVKQKEPTVNFSTPVSTYDTSNPPSTFEPTPHTVNEQDSRKEPINSFQYKVIRNVVEEVMVDFQESIRQDVQNLHIELLREFQIQQNEIRNIIEQTVPTQELVQLLRELREENKLLRNHY
ncbi:WD40-repeat-containing domain protein [Globomyces pollinis-pini]|nr:WD40-repeat-containing domain protein [Globomyces pollinis-pini]